MIELVNDLLNISRIESGRIIIDPEPVRLQEVIDEVVSETMIKINARKQRIILNIQPDLPEVSLDKKLIREVYANLITNASKYTPDEGEIRILVSIKGDDLVSVVGDTGYGIEEKDKGKIFSKFFRGVKTSKLDTAGNGLGLYLVKAIVDSSGGKIWFESQEGKGTAFTFTIPIIGMTKKVGDVSLA
jgi:signal transduction histidine kinase